MSNKQTKLFNLRNSTVREERHVTLERRFSTNVAFSNENECKIEKIGCKFQTIIYKIDLTISRHSVEQFFLQNNIRHRNKTVYDCPFFQYKIWKFTLVISSQSSHRKKKRQKGSLPQCFQEKIVESDAGVRYSKKKSH